MSPTACIADDDLLAFLQGGLAHDLRQSLTSHIDTCASCRELVAELARGSEDATHPGEASTNPLASRRILQPGELFGRYEIVAPIGRGGMAVVYEARDQQLARPVALKLLRPEIVDAHMDARLLAESRALARLSHPNVVQVYDAGRVDDVVFVAMERISGVTLGEWLDAEPRSLREILTLFEGAGRGLQAAHDAKLVHRDFKPSNVLVGTDRRVCVGDFGLARDNTVGLALTGDPAPSETSHESKQTAVGSIIGTPAYMAPEQIKGIQATAQSDQFSFCVALYEALTGQRPFRGTSLAKQLEAITAGNPDLIAKKDVPKHVQEAIRRGLLAAPEERHTSMEALLEALRIQKFSKRKRGLIIATGIGVVAAGLALLSLPTDKPLCDSTRQLQGIWDAEIQSRARTAAQSAGTDAAMRRWDTLAFALDAYANSWVRSSDAVCESRQRGAPRDLILPKERCLRSSREQLRSVTSTLARANVDFGKSLGISVDSLPLVRDCATDENAEAAPPSPTGNALRAQVDAIRDGVAFSEGLRVAGKSSEALLQLQALQTQAAVTQFPPLNAEIEFAIARTTQTTSSDVEVTFERLRGAVKAAEAAGHRSLTVKAWLALADFASATMQDPSRGREYAGYAEAALKNMRANDALLAEWHRVMGLAEWSDSDSPAALRHYTAAASLLKERDPVGYIEALNGLGLVYTETADYEKALETHLGLLQARVERYGPQATHVARSHTALGNVLMRMGRTTASLAHYQEAVRVARNSYGPNHYVVGITLHNLGGILRDASRPKDAAEALEEAVEIFAKSHGPSHVSVSKSKQSLGMALLDQGDSAGAVSALRDALAGKQATHGMHHPETAGCLSDLALALRAHGDYRESVSMAERSITAYESPAVPSTVDLARALVVLGESQRLVGDAQAASESLKRALGLFDAIEAAPMLHIAQAQRRLAAALWDLGGQRAEALRLARVAREALHDAENGDQEVKEISAWIEEREHLESQLVPN